MLRLTLVILWPSFLVAALADGLFFSLFDPDELLHLLGHNEVSAVGAYTLGFVFFWTGCALASMLTHYLVAVPADHNPPI